MTGIHPTGKWCGKRQNPARRSTLKGSGDHQANYICNQQGKDTITMGCTIACAMEIFETGIMELLKSEWPVTVR